MKKRTGLSGADFEKLVRQIARARWHLSTGEGKAEFIDYTEIDCVCRTEDVTHLIECTRSNKLEKVRKDTESLLKAKKFLERKRGQTVKPWIVTLSAPTAHQNEHARENGITILSFEEFQRSLLDAEGYFGLRSNYRFGSATDPVTESAHLPEDEYVDLPLRELNGQREESVSSITRKLEDNAVVVILGEYGAGKSLTVREIFYELRRRYYDAQHLKVPVAINLREHWGQRDTAEALRRHAKSIGFDRPSDLVRAWHAGHLIALLDGFDELAHQGLVSRPRGRRQARRAAAEVTRDFVSSARGNTGVLITGRRHYFDSPSELRGALGLRSNDLILNLGEFTLEKANEYLSQKGVDHALPQWVPRRPLLLGYLASSGLLFDVATETQHAHPGAAWNFFLNRIVEREARLSADMEPFVIRRLLERLATRTRLSTGTHELTEDDIRDAFRDVVGQPPVDDTHVLLQRLPGLTVASPEEGTRAFVADEMLDALQGSDVINFISDPYSPFSEKKLQSELSAFGASVLSYLCENQSVPQSEHTVAASQAINRWGDGTLALDCLIAASGRRDIDRISSGGVSISDGYVDLLDFENESIDDLSLHQCCINTLRLGPDLPSNVKIARCLIGKVEGIANEKALPDWFENNDVSEFEFAETTAAILELDLPLQVRVMLTILRKIFVQSGRGRKESALHRGMDNKAQGYVSDVIAILSAEGLISKSTLSGESIWHAEPNNRSRAMSIISAPGTSTDPALSRVREL